MPTVIEMLLKATWTVRPDTRALHGLACDLFEGDDVDGQQHIGQEKPFSVAPLRSMPDGPPDEWLWRAAWLPDTPVPAAALSADSLRVGHVTCLVIENVQRRVTRAALAATPPTAAVTVSFDSPTYFSRNGSDHVQPDPHLIVGSWRRRWNASLPPDDSLTIENDTWRDVHPLLELASFNLRTQPRDTGHGRNRLGFTGTAELKLSKTASPTARTLLATLSRFAEFSGTGAQTTHGFGTTTLPHPPAPR